MAGYVCIIAGTYTYIKVICATILALRMPATTLLLPPKTSNKASLANNAHHIQIAKSIKVQFSTGGHNTPQSGWIKLPGKFFFW